MKALAGERIAVAIDLAVSTAQRRGDLLSLCVTNDKAMRIGHAIIIPELIHMACLAAMPFWPGCGMYLDMKIIPISFRGNTVRENKTDARQQKLHQILSARPQVTSTWSIGPPCNC